MLGERMCNFMPNSLKKKRNGPHLLQTGLLKILQFLPSTQLRGPGGAIWGPGGKLPPLPTTPPPNHAMLSVSHKVPGSGS